MCSDMGKSAFPFLKTAGLSNGLETFFFPPVILPLKQHFAKLNSLYKSLNE